MNSHQSGKESGKSRKKFNEKALSGKNSHFFGILSIVALAIIAIVTFLWLNEILDIPHYLLGAPQTPINRSEAAIETVFILGFGIFILLLLKSNISKKNRAEQQRLAAVTNTANAMDAGLLMLNRDGRIFFINQALINMVGYEMSDLLGEALMDLGKKFSIPDDRQIAIEAIKTTLRGEVPTPAPITIKSRDGKEITVLCGVSFIRDSEEKLDNTIITFRDISDLKRTQEDLINTSSYLESLIYYANAPIIVWDPHFVITRFNHAFELLAGRKADEVIGQKLSVLFPEESRNDSMEKIEFTLRGQFWESVDIPILHSNGSIKFAIWNSANIYEDDGVNIKATIAQGQDITSRKKTEKALRDSEKWSNLLLRTIPSGLFTVDLNRRITSWNEVAVEITGLKAMEVIGKHCLSVMNSESCREECVLFAETVSKPIHQKECTIHVNNRDIILSKNIDILRDSRGKPIGGLESFNDITEYKHLEEKLRQSHKMEAIGRLAGGVAHDFNNLLTAILGYSDLALQKSGEGSSIATDIREIKVNTERAAEICQRLLAVSRKQVLKLRVINLNDTIDSIADMIRRVIGENIEVETNMEDNLWKIKADDGQLGQVILNLVINARDAMPDGGTITLTTENVVIDKSSVNARSEATIGNYICLTVKDTGIGMDDETLSRVFEPFFSTKGEKGTGLGLSTVYGIVKQHHGWVEIESKPGDGSSFRVFLTTSVSDQKRIQVDEIPSDLLVDRKCIEKILVVEDDPGVLSFITRALREKGYTVVEAVTAEKAIESFEREKGEFDLLFSDVVLPGMSGIELVDKILKVKPELPVVLTSGYMSYKSDPEFIRKKGLFFLSKPYNVKDLYRIVTLAFLKRQ